MAFQAVLGFMSDNARREFSERILPKLPGCHVTGEETSSSAEGEESEAFTHRLQLTISSPMAARDLCHHLTGFLNHLKGGVLLEWTGQDGAAQALQLSGQAARDAEIAAVRLAASVKAHNDAEKAAAKGNGGASD